MNKRVTTFTVSFEISSPEAFRWAVAVWALASLAVGVFLGWFLL